MLFTEELRKCLNAAGLSDCGENDAWNYWYQRVLKAHNEAVERQIATEQAENAKLRDLCEWLLNPYRLGAVTGEGVDKQWCRETYDGGSYRLRELGIEVDG